MKSWAVRRRMAYGAYLFGLVIFPIAYIKYPELGQLTIPYYSLITFILTSYYGFVTYNDVKDKQNDSV